MTLWLICVWSQVVMLVALMSGKLDAVEPSQIQHLLASYTARLHAQCPDLMTRVSTSSSLSPAMRAELDDGLDVSLKNLGLTIQG